MTILEYATLTRKDPKFLSLGELVNRLSMCGGMFMELGKTPLGDKGRLIFQDIQP